jgi:hypothetical protein
MKKLTLALVAAAGVWAGPLAAQTAPAENAALRQQIERRFEVLVLTDRIVLRPRSAAGSIRTIELGGPGTIAIDGAPATGGEVRDRLGADADAVLQLSYLDGAQRRALFSGAAAASPAVPATPAPPAPPEPATAPAPPPPLPPIESTERRRVRRGDRLRFGGNVRVEEDELITGDVVAIGGSARIDGEVRGEVVVVGGNVELGPRALITRDLAVVGGMLQRAEGARVQGQLHEIGVGELDFGDFAPWRDWRRGSMRGFTRTLALMSTLGRVAILCVLGALVMLLGRQYVEKAGLRAVAEPLKAGAVGFLAQLLFLPVLLVTIVILIVTLIGIPLLLLIPFALLGLCAIALLGFTSMAYRIGQFVSERFGWGFSGPYAATILGVLVIVSPLLLGRLLSLIGGPIMPIAFGLFVIAFIVEYLVWTIGFGAVALARLDRPRPPAAPIAAAPPVLP